MAETLKLNILAPERRLLEGSSVEWVMLTTSEGQLQILPGHAPMLGTLETGIFTYRSTKGTEETGVISTGFFEIQGGEVSVMAETIELKQEINIERAKAAQKKAETTLQEAGLDEHAFRKYQLKLQRALVRQQLASRD